MIWANFLHFYQPPTQKKYWVDKVTDECYRRVVAGFLENPKAKLTLNINSVLCELWEKWGHGDVIDGVKKLLERGQVELTGSAKFHPLLPQFPKEIVIRQIKLNDEAHRRFFGKSYQPRGFFPPEMAYNRYLAQVVSELGFEWIIGEELSLGKPVDYSKIYEVKDIPVAGSSQNLKMFFRDRSFSYKVLAGYLGTGKLFLDELRSRFPDDNSHFLLTAMDGETFGHHRPGMERLLLDLFKLDEIELVHISDLSALFANREVVETVPSTWALMEHEVEKNLPFARWDDPENGVHKLQWELTNLAIEAVKRSNNARSWLLLDSAVHSDQFWWASAKPWWSVEYIERGAKELMEAVKSAGWKEESEKAQALYYKILETAFEYQRSGMVDEISRKEDETIRMRTDQTLPAMPKDELLKIIGTIRKEMLAVAQNSEYERAAQLRDRIKELEGYLKN
jgi:alpha-amylase/alpha-mannosidase (GH57 family)